MDPWITPHPEGTSSSTSHDGPRWPSAERTPEVASPPCSLALATCSLPRALAEEILGDMQDLRGEWEWRKNEPRCGNDKRYADLSARIDMLDAILRGQENVKAEPRPLT